MSQNGENKHQDKENNPFSVPGNYFDSFSKKMMHKIELSEELKEFKLLSSIDKKLPFLVPENYFEVQRELVQYPVLWSLKSKKVFAVPEQYFENSCNKLFNQIEIADELASYPALSAIDKQPPFTVPVAYFENSVSAIKETIHASNRDSESQFGRILHIVFSKKTVYAMAAILVISLGLYFYTSNSDTVAADCNTLACLEKNEIIETSQLNNFDDESLFEIVNANELSKNLDKTLHQENKKTGKKDGTEEFVMENVDINDITDEI